MSFKQVKHTNPVKRPAMEALKKLTGGTKITNVEEDETSFRGNVFKSLGNHKFEALGNVVVTKEQVVSMGLLPLGVSEEVESLSSTSPEVPVSVVSSTSSDEVSSQPSSVFG